MQAPRLLLVRHGQTAYNLARRVQGQLQIPLNDQGRAQARELAEALDQSPLRPQALACSDLIRASETAAILAEVMELPEALPDLRWRSRLLGAFEGHTREEMAELDLEGFAAWKADPLRVAAPGGESGLDQRSRVRAAMEDLRPRFTEVVRRLCVVTHEGCLRAGLAIAEGDRPDSETVELGNAAVVVLEPQAEGWKFCALYRSLSTLK